MITFYIKFTYCFERLFHWADDKSSMNMQNASVVKISLEHFSTSEHSVYLMNACSRGLFSERSVIVGNFLEMKHRAEIIIIFNK